MRSIQTKIVIMMISILVIFGIVSFIIAYNNTKTVLDKNMETVLNLTGDTEKKNLDESLRSMEQSVNTIYNYAYQQIENDPEILEDEDKREIFLEDFGNVARNIAENTVGSISTYFRFNPGKYGGDCGFWYLYNEDLGMWEDMPPTDINQFDKDDSERVGWYYIPVKQKMPMWMDVYYNQNIGMEMFSYVIPFFYKGSEVGVVAMDIDVKVICESISKITAYDTGKALLIEENGNVVYHESYPDGCNFSDLTSYEQNLVKSLLESNYDQVLPFVRADGIDRRIVLKKLRNGMVLGIYVPLSEVNEPQNILLRRYLVFICIMLLASIAICTVWIRSVTQPLKELTRGVKEFESGRFDTEIDIKSKDEVGVLADSFRHMAKTLKGYIEVINDKAQTDALTGLNNSSAYSQMEESINNHIKEGTVSFYVVVMDINNLKNVNDTCGHKDGDELISLVAFIIEKAFGKRAVFRIGGDEFAAVLRDADESHVLECMDKVSTMLKVHNAEYRRNDWRGNVSIAMGMAMFREGVDHSYVDVFNVADEKMYENKRRMKAEMAAKG